MSLLLALQPHLQPGFYLSLIPVATVVCGMVWMLHAATRADPVEVAEFEQEIAEEEADLAEDERELARQEREPSRTERPIGQIRPGFKLEQRADGSWAWVSTNGGESDDE